MKSLSNFELAKKLKIPMSKIINYSLLRDYDSIDDLLGENDFRILLLEDKENSGHWTCILKLPEGLCYFNSYGEQYDKDLSIIPRMVKKILGEDKPEITRLLGGQPCNYNKTKFQSDTSENCGRFVMWIIYKCIMNNFGFDEALDLLKSKGPDYDKYVEVFT
jgi:hypothetical protein